MMNMGVHMSFELVFSYSLDKYPEVEQLNGRYSVNFVRDPHTIFDSGCTSLHSRCIRVLFSPHSHQHVFLVLCDNRHSNKHSVIAHCGFDQHFHNNQWFNLFSHASWPSVYLLWKNVCSSPLPMFQSGCFGLCWC